MVLTLAAVGTSLDGLLGRTYQRFHWECPPFTCGRWSFDLQGSYFRGNLRANLGRQSAWVPWTLTPKWSCSSHGGYADVSFAMLSADVDTWRSCRQWHYQPNVKLNIIEFPGFVYTSSTGREPHKGSIPGYPPKFECKRAQMHVGMAYWLTSLLFAAYPILAFIRGPLRRWRTPKHGHCRTCAYDLTGNESGTCPECGTEIEAKGHGLNQGSSSHE